jgi:hypothetical protein
MVEKIAGDLEAAYPNQSKEPERYGKVCILFDLQSGDLHYTSTLKGPFLVGVLVSAAMVVQADMYGRGLVKQEIPPKTEI